MSDGTLGLSPLGLDPLGGFPAEFAKANTDPYGGLLQNPARDDIILIDIERLPAGASGA